MSLARQDSSRLLPRTGNADGIVVAVHNVEVAVRVDLHTTTREAGLRVVE